MPSRHSNPKCVWAKLQNYTWWETELKEQPNPQLQLETPTPLSQQLIQQQDNKIINYTEKTQGHHQQWEFNQHL